MLSHAGSGFPCDQSVLARMQVQYRQRERLLGCLQLV